MTAAAPVFGTEIRAPTTSREVHPCASMRRFSLYSAPLSPMASRSAVSKNRTTSAAR